jgi:hypothetical protein
MPLGAEPAVGYSGHVSFVPLQGGDPLRHVPKPAELRVSAAEIARMERAAAVIADCCAGLAAQHRGILDTIVPAGDRFAAWRRYPEGEIYDPVSHAQYFYHIHPAERCSPREHGHFHTFLRAEGMPPGAVPLVLPEAAVAARTAPPQAAPGKRGASDEVSHLVAIALDGSGEPCCLFTTNRWVTGETWYRADDVIAMLDRFVIAAADPPELRDRWLCAVLELFRPQIAALLHERDAKVMAWRQRRNADVFEDRRLEIASSREIDLAAQLAFLDRVRARAAADSGPRLPRMAEGWGESPQR